MKICFVGMLVIFAQISEMIEVRVPFVNRHSFKVTLADFVISDTANAIPALKGEKISPM